jgi:superfamily I DNA/RNA helicase
MDLAQEEIARNLGNGHRVIHGVAGSGKTLILGYRAEHLAKLCTRPILILCYNKTLAAKLASVMHAKGMDDRVHVANFHSWCVRQLNAYNIEKPPQAKRGEEDAFFEGCVERVIRGVDSKHIPSAQYDAVLIDEGHDFKPAWFKLVVQMIHPDTNSLLVLYDDAQSIYNGPKKLRFSFSSVGVQAKGRTTILKLNYRNTAEILAVARAFADDLLSPSDTEEDQAPTVLPMSAGRRGPKPLLIKLPSLKEEAAHLANRLKDANRTGMPWNDMAVLYRHYGIGKEVADTLTRMGVPFQWQQDKKQKFEPLHDSVKLITLHSSKGLEFPLVCLPAIGTSDDKEHVLEDEARLLYVAMTRATQELVMTHHEESVLGEKVRKAMGVWR